MKYRLAYSLSITSGLLQMKLPASDILATLDMPSSITQEIPIIRSG